MGSGIEARATLVDCSWSRSPKLLHGGAWIWVPVTQSKFVGQAS